MNEIIDTVFLVCATIGMIGLTIALLLLCAIWVYATWSIFNED